MSDQAKAKPPETIRGVMNSILRECRVPAEKQDQYHQRLSRAVWRDREEALAWLPREASVTGGEKR